MIKQLVDQHREFKPLESFSRFFLKWSFFTSLYFSVCAYLLPLRHDLEFHFFTFTFQAENILWLVSSFVSILAFYKSTFPEKLPNSYIVMNIISYTALFSITLYRFDHLPSIVEWKTEMSFWQGRCGFLIIGFCLLNAPIYLLWAKPTAPHSPGLTGVLSALSTGSLGCLLMQIICFHPEPLHLVIWHFVPLSILGYLAHLTAKKYLSW